MDRRPFLIAIIVLLRVDLFASPFDLDLKELDATRRRVAPPPASPSPPARKPTPSPLRQDQPAGWVSYTIRPGDHLFRILMTRFGYTNAEAERVIPQILEKNGITDIRRLTVGKVISVPTKGTVTAAKRIEQNLTSREKTPPPRKEPPPSPRKEEEAAVVAEKGETPPPVPPVGETVTPPHPETPQKTVSPTPPAAPPPPPLTPVGPLIVMPVTVTDQPSMILGIADALQLVVERNVIIEAGDKEGGFSIKVPLTLEGNGRRIVVSGSTTDPFQYTLFRLLESSGQTVLQLAGKERFPEIAQRIIEGIGLPVRKGRFVLTSGGGEEEADGFLIETAGGRMLLTDRPISGIRNAAERSTP